MNNKVKVALAGISGYGDSYLEALMSMRSAPSFELVGVVETLPRLCRRLPELSVMNVTVHSSMDSLFAQTAVDLMLIVTPIHLHARQTCFALQHGANVLCEKPVAGTVPDALKMLDAQQLAKGFAAIGYQWSFSEPIQSLKRDIMRGAFGRPIRMKALALFPRPMSYFRRNDWVGRMHTGGGDGVFDSPVNNATAHYLHNMFYLLGPTRETSAMPVQVEAELYRANDVENYDTAALRCRTDCGTEVLFYTTLAAPDRQGPRSLYEFEDAVIEHDAAGSGQFIARYRDGRTHVYGKPNHDPDEKIRQCIDASRTGDVVACGIPAAMAHMLCVAAAQESVPTIVDFPAAMRRTIGVNGDAMICIDGLQEVLSECYEAGALPAERRLGNWAVTGKLVDIAQPELPRRRVAPVAIKA